MTTTTTQVTVETYETLAGKLEVGNVFVDDQTGELVRVNQIDVTRHGYMRDIASVLIWGSRGFSRWYYPSTPVNVVVI